MLLLLRNSEKDEVFYQGEYPQGSQIATIYKNGTRIEKAIQRLWFRAKLPFYQQISFGDWLKEQYDVIIIEALKSKRDLILFLLKKYPNTKIILWYWNTVSNICIDPADDICNSCELWSFDIEDCKKYNMKFNSQFYNREIRLPQSDISYDIFFVGADKGRGEYIKELQQKLSQQNLKADFHVTNNGNYVSNIQYQKPISYNQVLQRIARTRAILDVPLKGQTGLTLRPLEALFFSKKLITTAEEIKNYDFYYPENIYILSDNNLAGINNFLEIPYKIVPQKIIDNYDMRSWLIKFMEKKNV